MNDHHAGIEGVRRSLRCNGSKLFKETMTSLVIIAQYLMSSDRAAEAKELITYGIQMALRQLHSGDYRTKLIKSLQDLRETAARQESLTDAQQIIAKLKG